MIKRSEWWVRGVRNGVPIFLGYLAVSFTFGIAAKGAGLNTWQATLMSATNLTSAGQFAALGVIAAGAPYYEMLMTQVVLNLRYSLMSCALSQKLHQNSPILHRFIIGYGVTDEVFATAVSVEGKLSPFYAYGLMCAAVPGWVLGTLLGGLLGAVLPVQVLSAFGVALYGMFIAIILPPARKSRVIAGVVVISMTLSLLFAVLPLLNQISSSLRIVILSVGIAAVAAVLFPLNAQKSGEGQDEVAQEERA